MKRIKKIISLLLIMVMMFNASMSAYGLTENKLEENEIANYTTKEGTKVVLTAEGSLVRQYEDGVLVADARPDDKGNKVISREYVNGKLDKTTNIDIKIISAQPASSKSYSYMGTMYYTNPILQEQKNIETYLEIGYLSDQMYVVNAGTYKMVALIAMVAIGLSVSPNLAGAILGAIFGDIASVTLTELFEVRCDLWRYTWKGTSTPDTSYPDGFHYGTKAMVESTGDFYTEGYTSVFDWEDNITFQRLMYYQVYGIEVYPDYCE